MKFAALAALTATVSIASAAHADTLKVPEGTELPIELAQDISSKMAMIGNRFTITLAEDVRLADGTVLKAGYRGVGDVIDARGAGMLGKRGKLAVRLLYLRVGDARIRLRATRSTWGARNTGVQVGTALLALPAAPFIKGHSAELKRGYRIAAFTEEDSEVRLPLPAPPASPLSEG